MPLRRRSRPLAGRRSHHRRRSAASGPGTRAWTGRSPSRWSGTSKTSCCAASPARCRAAPATFAAVGTALSRPEPRRSCSTAQSRPRARRRLGSASRSCPIGARTSTQSRTSGPASTCSGRRPGGSAAVAGDDASERLAGGVARHAMQEAGRSCSPREEARRAIAASTTPTTARRARSRGLRLSPRRPTAATRSNSGSSLADSPLLVERVVSLAPVRARSSWRSG